MHVKLGVPYRGKTGKNPTTQKWKKMTQKSTPKETNKDTEIIHDSCIEIDNTEHKVENDQVINESLEKEIAEHHVEGKLLKVKQALKI